MDKHRISIVALLALTGFAIALLVALSPAGASIQGDAPPASGNWVINNQTRTIDEVLTIQGNIEVKNTLELWNTTIYMNLGYDKQYMINVTGAGNLKANNSHFTSTVSYREYGWQVLGRMNLRDSLIEETYDGIQVLTDRVVLIQGCTFTNFVGMGLYLENANGTTLKDIFIQSDDMNLYVSGSMYSSGYQDRPSMSVTGTGVLYIRGGNPTIDGVEVSVNGTVTASIALTKSYYYMYAYVYLDIPIVSIDSKDMKTISGITVRDSSISFDVDWHLYGMYISTSYSQYYYIYTYYSASAISIINYRDVLLKECKGENIQLGDYDADYIWHYSANYMNVYPYTYNQGMSLFSAMITEKFMTPGPHDFMVSLKDASFEDINVLSTVLSPDYGGTVAPTFRSKVVVENVRVNGGKNPFSFSVLPPFSAYKIFYHDVLVRGCTFTNLSGSVCQLINSAGPGASSNVRSFDLHEEVIIEDCTFRDSKQGQYGFVHDDVGYRYEYNNLYDRHILIRNNLFRDNEGAIAYLYGNPYTTLGNGRFTFYNNTLVNNTGTSREYFFYIWQWDRTTISSNKFVDCVYYYGIVMMDYGGYGTGKNPAKFLVANNTFIDSYALYVGSYTGALLGAYWGGDLEISGNYVTGGEGYVISFYEYTYYAGYSHVEIKENTFENNNATLVYFYGYSSYHPSLTAIIDNNTAMNNTRPFVDYYFYSYYMENYDYDATIFFRGNKVSGFEGAVFKNYGNLVVSDNTFRDCGGYVIELKFLHRFTPVIANNVIIDCGDVYYIGSKPKGYLKMSIAIKNIKVDCTGNAFHFQNVDVTMENVEVSDRATPAIVAEDSNVDAVSSKIPVGSGEIIGEGEIYVWFNIEVFVEWSNVSAPEVSSGVRVSEALVVLYGGSGAYYASQYTDDNGHLRQMRIPQWNMKGSFTNIWTPYTITVAKSGVTSTTEFDLDHDYVGPEALDFLLVDKYIPVIRITSPFPSDVFSIENLTLYGFTTEVGSGIKDVHVHFTDDDGNDLPTVEVEVDENGDFTHTFSDLPEGENIVMHATVRDIALNSNHTMVSIVIDRTSPWLQVHSPEEGITTNQLEIDILGDYEPGAMIKINGRERGDASGILNERYTLSEGNNTLIIEATDRAGNTATVTRTLRLDRFSPTLTVLAPRDGLRTRVTNIAVEGDVEEGAEITVSVYRPGTDLINDTITPKPDGTFSHKVDLEEGENTIVVRAEDGAGNVAQVSRKVYLDITPPPCEILFPPNGHVTNENVIEVRGTAEPTATLYLNGKQIFNTGTIQREVSLNEGDNIIEIKVVDAIGNEYKHRVTVTLDTTAPEITMVRPLAETLKTNVAELQVVGIITGGPHKLTVLGIDTTFDAEGKFDTTVTLPQEGMVEVVIEARDRAGNAVTHTIFVDFSTTKPMLNIVYEPDDADIRSEDSNLFIRGTTTPGVKEVKVTHTASGVPRENTYAVGPDGSFSVARALLEGENAFVVTVVDSYGNMNETAEHTVNYKYMSPPGEKETKEKWDLTQISLLILVIALAFFATAVYVTRSTSRR